MRFFVSKDLYCNSAIISFILLLHLAFDTFLDFPKPILVAANGPAIGASVTSATLCDAVIASPSATFSTPFARLGVPPEGCSSVHFETLMGSEYANKMLRQDWVPSAADAKQIGLIREVISSDSSGGDIDLNLQTRAQELGEEWIRTGKQRQISGAPGKDFSEWHRYKEILSEVNDSESATLASEFLSERFLLAQYTFLRSKGKHGLSILFWTLARSRFLWKHMLKQ